jgi:hypothetical protein
MGQGQHFLFTLTGQNVIVRNQSATTKKFSWFFFIDHQCCNPKRRKFCSKLLKFHLKIILI